MEIILNDYHKKVNAEKLASMAYWMNWIVSMICMMKMGSMLTCWINCKKN